MGGAGLPSSGSVGGATGPITVLGFNYRPLVLLGRFGGCLPTASSGEDRGVDLFQGSGAFHPPGWMPWRGWQGGEGAGRLLGRVSGLPRGAHPRL